MIGMLGRLMGVGARLFAIGPEEGGEDVQSTWPPRRKSKG